MTVTRQATRTTTGTTHTVLLDRRDLASYPVTLADGTALGNIVPAADGTWLAQPRDMETTTVWGCDTQEEALSYLLDTQTPTQEEANYQAIRDSLNHQDWDGQRRTHTVVLEAGEKSWNPASTKEDRQLSGPAHIEYVEYRDGSVYAHVS